MKRPRDPDPGGLRRRSLDQQRFRRLHSADQRSAEHPGRLEGEIKAAPLRFGEEQPGSVMLDDPFAAILARAVVEVP